MDKFDEKLLSALQSDCKAGLSELADKVGLSASACHKRMKAIEQSGMISGYVAILSEQKLGLKSNVFVQVTLKNQKEDTLAAFEKAVFRHEDIMECYLMAGDSDFLLRILCRDADDYERIHNEILTRLPNVDRVKSNFAIRKVFRRTAIPSSAY